MWKNKLHKNPMKLKIIMSYFILLIVVVTLITIPFYSVTSVSMKREISRTNIGMFENIARLIDNNLEMIDNSTLNLSREGTVNEFMEHEITDGFTAQDIDAINTMQQALSNLAQTNRMISSAYLYNASSDVVLTSDGGYARLEDFSDDSWLRLLNADYGRTWDKLRTDKQGRRYLSLVRGVPAFTPIKKGAIVVNIAEDKLYDMLGGSAQAGTDTAILSRDGELIQSSRELDTVLFTGLPDNDSGYVNRKGNVVTYYVSDYTQWKYVSITEEGQLMGSINRILLFTLFIALAVMVLAVFLINRFSGMVYRPIQDTVELIGRLNNSRPDKKSDEFDYIVGELKEMSVQRQQLQNNLDKSMHTFREQFVKKLLGGRVYQEEQLARNLGNVGFQAIGECYAAVIVEVDGQAQFVQNNSAADRALWMYGIANMAQEIFGQRCSVLLAEEDGRLVGLLNGGDTLAQDALRTAEELKTSVRDLLNISLTVALSAPVEGIERVSMAYRQAQCALRRKFVLGMNHVIVYSEGDEEGSLELGRSLEVQRVANGIKSGDVELLGGEIDSFVRDIKQRRSVDVGILMANVMLSVKRIYGELEEYGLPGIKLDESTYRQLSQLETVDELDEWLRDTFASMCEEMAQKESKGTRYIDEILEYIDSHYREDISLVSIADMVGISTSYVSTIINAELGTSLVNYVNRKRIEDAKKILVREKGLPIDAVREMVGYSNVHTFMRIFKKYEGITPGKYRELNN